MEELIDLFAEWAATGKAEIDRPDAAARLFFDIVVGDSMLNTLMGIEVEWLDSEQIDWRLQDRKCVGQGMSVSVRVDHGGLSIINKTIEKHNDSKEYVQMCSHR